MAHKIWYRTALTFLLLAPLASCDPPVATDTKIVVSDALAAMTACMGTCTDTTLSATDRATCRLNCDTAAKIPPFPGGPPPLASVAGCMGTCDWQGDVGAAKTCVDACRDPAVAPVVLDSLAACVSGCQTGAGISKDDRATCRLVCAQSASPAA